MKTKFKQFMVLYMIIISFLTKSKFIYLLPAMIINTMIIILLIFLQVIVSPLNINGNFIPPTTQNLHIYTVTTMSSYIHATLHINPYFSSVLLIIKNSPFTPLTNRQNWLHGDSLLSTNYDYEGLVTARNQYVWLANPGVGNTIYFYVVNFEPTVANIYTISVSQSNAWLFSCPFSVYYPGTNYCITCPTYALGNFCNINIHKLSSELSWSLTIQPNSYSFFWIPPQSDITIKFSTSAGGVTVYMQQIQTSNELAGIVNYLVFDGGQWKYPFPNAGQATATYSNDQSISIGVINTNNFTANFQISYSHKSKVNVMIIIIGVLGGLLFIGLIIAAVCILRKGRNQRERIHPNIAVTACVVSNKLTSQEINWFFPAVFRRLVIPEVSLSYQFNQQEKDKNNTQSEIQCIICLCNIEPEQMVRVAYCKHIFHQNCLSQWFSKQPNCPYCRKDYSRKGTVQLYNQLSKQCGKQLKGNQIAQQIFKIRQKLDCSLQTLQIEDIEGQDL